MSTTLWKVTAKKEYNKIAKGMWVEIIIKNSSMKPSSREIMEAFNAKYGDKTVSPGQNQSFFEIEKG